MRRLLQKLGSTIMLPSENPECIAEQAERKIIEENCLSALEHFLDA